MKRLISVLCLLAFPALAGQVPNPVNAPSSIAAGHIYAAGSNPQSAVDGGLTAASGALTSTSGNLGLFVPSGSVITMRDSTNGVGATFGGVSSTITGRINFVPATSNNPYAITLANSSNANQGLAISPLGNGQISFFLPNYSGTYSAPASNPYNCGGFFGSVIVCNNTDTLDASGATNPPTSLSVSHKAGGAGTKGGRWAISGQVVLNANTSDTTNSYYNSGVFHTIMQANAGGTAGTALGSAFGAVAYGELTSGATNFLEVAGEEFDLEITAGASGQKLHGASIVLEASNAVAPSIEATGFAISGGGGAATIQCALCMGRYDGTNALSSDAVVVGFHPQLYTGGGPSIAFGDDYRLVTFSGAVLAGPSNDILNNGSYRVGMGHIASAADGVTIDPTGSVGQSATVAAGGSGFVASPANVTDAYGGVWQITGISGSAVTTVSMLRAPHVLGAVPANPIALTPAPGQAGSGLTVNVTWGTGTTTHMNGVVITGAGSTVSGLPACNSGLKGARNFVTDASTATPSFMATLTGGGSAAVPVFCDGTNWRYG